MGNCWCCRGGKSYSIKKKSKNKKIKVPTHNETPSSSISGSITNINSSQEILDEDFKNKIADTVDEHMANIPIAYQKERDRLVNEMKRCAPERYLGLRFSDYPHSNGLMVNGIARRVVTSKEKKKQLIDQINERIEPTFESRTAQWNELSRKTARPLVKTFIEKLVNEAFGRLKLE